MDLNVLGNTHCQGKLQTLTEIQLVVYELRIEGSGLSCCNNTNCSFQYEVVEDIIESSQPHIHHKIPTLSIIVYSYTILTLSIGVTLTGYCTKCADKDTHEVDKLYHRLCS